MKTLLVVGCSPAWERGLRFSALAQGEVNRAAETWEYPAGKATNLCRAIRCWGRDACHAILLTCLGGRRGSRFQDACREEGLFFKAVECRGETRVCTNLLTPGGMTELVEEAPPLSPPERKRFLETLALCLEDADAVALAGNFPPETPPDFPRKIARLVASQGKSLFLDTWRPFPAMARICPSITLKINRRELAALCPGEPSLPKALEKLGKRHPQATLGVTDEAKEAWLLLPGEQHPLSFPVPPASPLVNSLGAGDTASGVFFAELLSGADPREAFSCALQAASLSCQTRIAGEFHPERENR
ncbi:MAG: 1-phosphofructokinase family hexose kinase [Oligosphaeraceae bacterium]